ncbi:MAG: helix-turn-helix domain-containing protein, partial [Odoribacter sp.]|nr:helix-turn-helix domain-containing protein [Odoribacter sp.]
AQAETLLRKREEVDVLFLSEGVSYDVSSSVLTVKGASVKLTKLESKVFVVLCKNPNKLIKRDLLLKAGWDSDEVRFDLQLNKVIRRLRTLLSPVSSVEIVTDKGNGYWFMCHS